jgi:hypothetical protein
MSRKIAETPLVAQVWQRSGKTPIKRAVPLRERDGSLRLEEKIFSPFPNCNAVETRPSFSPDRQRNPTPSASFRLRLSWTTSWNVTANQKPSVTRVQFLDILT